VQTVNMALRILIFVRNNALGKDKKGFPIFALMESTRQKKVSRLIQKELSVIFQQNTQEILGNIMVSLTIVRISPDLADANIFLSIFPVDDPQVALKVIRSNTVMIRKKLGESVRNQLRIVPTLQFHLDDSAAYAEEIDRLLKK
jgi:ribosome-binding factor A